MMGSRTLMLVKPDAIDRVGDILNRVQSAGFTITWMAAEQPNDVFMKLFYQEHKGKRSFKRQVDFMCSGNVCAVRLVKSDAVAELRKLVGATVPSEAEPGTLRYEFGDHERGLPYNAVHASDSDRAADREIDLVFRGRRGLYIDRDQPFVGLALGEESGKWSSPAEMCVFKVLRPNAELVIEPGVYQLAHTDFHIALRELSESGGDLWLCRATAVGQPKLIPIRSVGRPEWPRKFWSNSPTAWQGRHSPVSGGVTRVPYPGMVACSSISLLQKLDLQGHACPDASVKR
ncbi:MAG: nucleoside-diphosphate kinase [candidate division WS1 bacterium]|nr:nucleoside-diphosphate kinase [candidate division WS1 bacterium]